MMRFISRRTLLQFTLLAPVALIGTGNPGRADDPASEAGFERLFNGKDLTGWHLGDESLDGKTESADHRFSVKDGALVCTGGKPIKVVETTRALPRDFLLRLDFRASPKANSGLFLRGQQLQVRDYPTVGPYKALKHFKDGDWNAIEVKVVGDSAHCTCNGELLEEALKVKGRGGVGLQAETNTLEYRNIRVKELR
jgi:hypothetical protein